MLFLLKRTWAGSLAGLVVLAALGLGLRRVVPDPTPFDFSLEALRLGVLAFGLVLASDGLIHGLLSVALGERYLRRQRELADVFEGQTVAALVAGAVMAGVGEELVFRGLGTGPAYLTASAVVFGLLHHVRAALWPFTAWAVWEGLLFAAALHLTGNLAVTMAAHFLHDTAGFLLFRYLRRARKRAAGPVP
jgi:membrane protease YdiL (CAAX protease family)